MKKTKYNLVSLVWVLMLLCSTISASSKSYFTQYENTKTITEGYNYQKQSLQDNLYNGEGKDVAVYDFYLEGKDAEYFDFWSDTSAKTINQHTKLSRGTSTRFYVFLDLGMSAGVYTTDLVVETEVGQFTTTFTVTVLSSTPTTTTPSTGTTTTTPSTGTTTTTPSTGTTTTTPSTGTTTTTPSTGTTTTPSTGTTTTTPSTGTTTTPSTGTTTTTPSTGTTTTTPSTGTTTTTPSTPPVTLEPSNVLPVITQGAVMSGSPVESTTVSNYQTTGYGYLVETSSGYTRIESISADKTVYIEQYNDAFQRTSAVTIPVPAGMTRFGCFYEGANNYYLMFSGENPSESSAVEVVRIIKYDKYWNQQGVTSIRDINTVDDVYDGDMAESGGNLLVHTRHKMYTSATDGKNHQANLRFTIDIASMELLDSAHYVSNKNTGYVSHSFTQMIDVSSDGAVYTADLGDAHPRAVVAFSWPENNVVTPFPSRAEVLPIAGDDGVNLTKASLGGLQVGTSAVLVAGRSVTQNQFWSGNRDYNVYVTATPRDNFSTETSTITWLSNYTDSPYATTPKLVEITEDKFVVLWNEMPFASSPLLFWSVFDGSGKQVSPVAKTFGTLSLVEPIVNSEGKIVWYSTDRNTPIFHVFDVDSGSVTLYDSTSGGELSNGTGLLDGVSDWAVTFVQSAYDQNLLDGMDDIMGRYTSDITREEFCRLIMNVYRSNGKTAPSGSNPFTDTNHSDVISANQLGIVAGKTTSTFAPHDTISRQELAVMVLRTAGLFTEITGLTTATSFSDHNDIADWAKEAVFYAQREVFLVGNDNKIRPHDNLTCQEAIIIALRLAETF